MGSILTQLFQDRWNDIFKQFVLDTRTPLHGHSYLLHTDTNRSNCALNCNIISVIVLEDFEADLVNGGRIKLIWSFDVLCWV